MDLMRNGILLCIVCLLVVACSSSNAQNSTVTSGELADLEARVAVLEKLVPFDFSDLGNFEGIWDVREYEFGESLLGKVGTLDFRNILESGAGAQFELEYSGASLKSFSCTNPDVTVGPEPEEMDMQATLTLSCGSTANQMFVVNSRWNNIRMYHPGQNVFLVFSRSSEGT